VSDPIDLRDAHAVVDLFRRAAAAMAGSPARRASVVRLPDRGRLLATGDLHDNAVNLGRILRLARLEEHESHHLVLQEIIHGGHLVNGMDFSHRMLARVASLVAERPGQIHPLLANHELGQMLGRGVSKGAGDSVEQFNEGLRFAFGDDWSRVLAAIVGFIAAMPIAAVSESGVLCAHSLPNARMMERFDAGLLDRELVAEDYRPPTGSVHLMVWGRAHADEQVRALADRWGVRLFCLGHRHVETGVEARGPLVVVINSDHERGAVLPIDLARVPSSEEALARAVYLASVAPPGGAGRAPDAPSARA
jgi:hypothetical protein